MNGYEDFYDNRQPHSGCLFPFALFAAIFIVIVIFVFSGCKTIEYVEVPKVEKEYISKLDSIYFLEKDSIYIREKGDTVFVDKWHTRYKEVIRTDTILKSDSIRVPYPVNHYFQPTWWQQTKMGGFWFLLVVLCGIILIKRIV